MVCSCVGYSILSYNLRHISCVATLYNSYDRLNNILMRNSCKNIGCSAKYETMFKVGIFAFQCRHVDSCYDYHKKGVLSLARLCLFCLLGFVESFSARKMPAGDARASFTGTCV